MNFFVKANRKKSLAIGSGILAFLLAPAGLAGSLLIGAGVATIVMAVETANESETGEVDVCELYDNDEFREVYEGALLTTLVAGAIALPTGGGVLGAVVTLALILLARKATWHLVKLSGKEPFTSRTWDFSFKGDDREVTISI